jgi:hypothetical protein
LITLEGSLEDYGRERGVAREEERNSFSQNLERESEVKNGRKMALVALYSPCGLIVYGLTLIHNLILD